MPSLFDALRKSNMFRDQMSDAYYSGILHGLPYPFSRGLAAVDVSLDGDVRVLWWSGQFWDFPRGTKLDVMIARIAVEAP